MRNDLLRQIVVAAGGTVTDPNNRNKLLEDWLIAINNPSGRWYFTGNGVDQYVILNAEIETNDTITFKYKLPQQSTSGANVMLASGLVNIFYILNGKFYTDLAASSVEIRMDGAVIIEGVTDVPNDGLEHEILVKLLSSNIPIKYIGKGKDGNPFYCDFPIYNVKINDGSVYNYPLDDSFANNPVARNTGTGANGTYINATEASWSYE